MEGFREYRNVCSGETRRERTASQEVEFAPFEWGSGEVEDYTPNLNKSHGERVVEYMPIWEGQ